MTVNHQLPDAAVRVSAHCSRCKADVETDGSNRCPTCEYLTVESSRGTRRIVSLAALAQRPEGPSDGGGAPDGQNGHEKPSTGEQKAYMIPPSREARAYGSARARLLASLERQEAEAQARYDVAREELRRVKTARAALARDCELIMVDAGPVELAAPRTMRMPSGRVKGAWPVTIRSHVFESCGDCGSADRPHRGRGRCEACYEQRWPTKERITDGN